MERMENKEIQFRIPDAGPRLGSNLRLFTHLADACILRTQMAIDIHPIRGCVVYFHDAIRKQSR